MGATLGQKIQDASPEVQYQIERLLRQDADDRAWARQLGPAYRQGDVARLLGKTRQAVSADRGLLRLEQRSGDIAYPIFQFDGRRQLPGVREVVGLFRPVVTTAWTIASWLTSPALELDERTPIDMLREGGVERVIELARQTAAVLER